MKFRISNERNSAVEFDAEFENFDIELISASQKHNLNTMRKVHRGEISKNVVWIEPAHLHLWLDDGWFRVGIAIPIIEADTLDDANSQDAEWISANVGFVWSQVIKTYRHSEALKTFVMSVGDEIDRHEAAVSLGSIRTEKKSASSAANGKLGGRPKKEK